ncbi:MAG: PIN domain-containing protein [Desulfobulbaceae bacterium]|nr:PIN domain-containing protein [Desulfobulbaceae bacterium]
MRITADTNTFLATALNEPEKKAIIEITTGHELVSPEILPFEIGNALSAAFKKKRLTKEEVVNAYKETQQIPVESRKIDIKSALEIACEHNIYAYDAYFLECAKSLRCPLLTLDGPLRKVAKKLGIKLIQVAA